MSVAPEVLLRAEQTGGAMSAIAIAAPAGWAGTPLHHHAFDETFLLCTPAGFERYFARLAAERQGAEPPAWALQPDP